MTAVSSENVPRLRQRKGAKTYQYLSSVSAQQSGRTGTKSWAYVVRWTARVLLIFLSILSCVRIVEIAPQKLLLNVTKDRNKVVIGRSTALLVLTHDRPAYLKTCIESIVAFHPRDGGWPVVISEDRQGGEVPEVAKIVKEVMMSTRESSGNANEGNQIKFVPLIFDEPYVRDVEDQGFFRNTDAYRKITKHYGWALERVFSMKEIERIVIVEDDMEIAVDFYDYFGALAPLLDKDPSLFCVSAWNDNGKEQFAIDPKRLYRTDFFPGLGWMLTRRLWETELRDKWPKLFWDDWMRSSNQTRGRQCIRPEISRTANFGEKGVSKSFDYEPHVSKVVLNKQYVDFWDLDLGYLDADEYFKTIFSRMSNATLLTFSNYLKSRPQDGDVIARFPTGKLQAIGRRIGLMSDHRDGMWRTSYHGVIVIPWNGHWAFIVDRKYTPPNGYKLGAQECCYLT
eukprot:Plantae.Rhodophyta-Hildenbrandia_rubra.ctg5701.p1 GENE.Plantae.Rhodophyta-Hildenbrandia_rubra.ctg5701~~Plantae.Rhodophyta-Hildenbrandia_rubra.ctg5701.p1  ORF type:complete len:454 (+),score=42.77 Plantae.Rhodophyta-Hildenbrandia_rubra.ctg5701:170-1531(+)